MYVKSLITLDEWNEAARRGTVEEPSFNRKIPSTGIECPNRVWKSGIHHLPICRAHLWDLPGVFRKKDGYMYRKVVCGVCEWIGERVVSIKVYLGGKD